MDDGGGGEAVVDAIGEGREEKGGRAGVVL